MSDRFEVSHRWKAWRTAPAHGACCQTFDPIPRLGYCGASVGELPAWDRRGESKARQDFDLETMVMESGQARRGPKNRSKQGA